MSLGTIWRAPRPVHAALGVDDEFMDVTAVTREDVAFRFLVAGGAELLSDLGGFRFERIERLHVDFR